MSTGLDSVFWLSVSTLICGGFALLIKTIYRIKCNEVVCCCGLLQFKREIDDEVKIDLDKHEHGEKSKRSSISFGFNNK